MAQSAAAKRRAAASRKRANKAPRTLKGRFKKSTKKKSTKKKTTVKRTVKKKTTVKRTVKKKAPVKRTVKKSTKAKSAKARSVKARQARSRKASVKARATARSAPRDESGRFQPRGRRSVSATQRRQLSEGPGPSPLGTSIRRFPVDTSVPVTRAPPRMRACGTRAEVFDGLAMLTKGLERKEDLILNAKGFVTSIDDNAREIAIDRSPEALRARRLLAKGGISAARRAELTAQIGGGRQVLSEVAPRELPMRIRAEEEDLFDRLVALHEEGVFSGARAPASLAEDSFTVEPRF